MTGSPRAPKGRLAPPLRHQEQSGAAPPDRPAGSPGRGWWAVGLVLLGLFLAGAAAIAHTQGAPAGGCGTDTRWTDSGRTGTAARTSLTGLDNGVSYQVRVAAVNSVGDGAWSESTTATPEERSDEPVVLDVVVVSELEHDTAAFTQGLEIYGGRLFESTGAPGNRSSSIRELDRGTGRVLRLHEIRDDVFAEGLTFVAGQIYQLTWRDGVAFVRDRDDLSEVKRFTYAGEGWGLCYNGTVLVMSDGSAQLHFRDPVTFGRVGNPVTVTLGGEELSSINELECVGADVYANVWQTDTIVKIDPATGHVTAVADASGIGLPRPSDPDAVLNGIAWDPMTQTFLITGKDWPVMYEVRFEPGTA